MTEANTGEEAEVPLTRKVLFPVGLSAHGRPERNGERTSDDLKVDSLGRDIGETLKNVNGDGACPESMLTRVRWC